MAKDDNQSTRLEKHLSINPPPRAMLGAEKPINAISERVFKALTTQEASEPLVVGLYGEWGCGKSFWLESIRHQVLVEQEKDDSTSSLIIPIFFNAWRFEKEEHLIVPLLKATALTLMKCSDFDKNENWQTRLREVAVEIGFSAAAIAYGLAKELDKQVTGIKLIGALEEAEKKKQGWLFDRKPKQQSAIDEIKTKESRYFDFHQTLNKILSGSADKKPIRLLFLIDDLDRCLPEKAVEMLESIKLFLEVKGTAFVVAVDDEVVEGGIAHRYKDYRYSASESDYKHECPVTGHEYLEKIIHLPVRIDRPQELAISNFIQSRCPDLAKLMKEEDGTYEFKRIEQVLIAIPPVPRKLIRLSELYGLKRDILDLSIEDLPSQLNLLRIVALQLFSPEIYRLAQRRQISLLGRLEEIKNEFSNKKENKFLWPNYQKLFDKIKEREKDETHSPASRRSLEQIVQPLLLALIELQKHRSGFDPGLFLDHWQAQSVSDWRPYFGIPLPIQSSKALSDLPSDAAVQRWQDLAPQLLSQIIEILSSDSPSYWQEGRNLLSPNQKLSISDTIQLADTLTDSFKGTKEELRQQWLLENSIILTPDGIVKAAEAVKLPEWANKQTLLDKFESDAPAAEMLKAGDMLGYLGDDRPGVGIQKNTIKAYNYSEEIQKLLGRLSNLETTPQQRLEIGDQLDKLGDPRPGIGLTKDDLPVPDIDWIPIPAGTFDFDENLKEVRVQPFEISRYCISNAQYQAFVDNGGYDDAQWWQDLEKTDFEASKWPQNNRPKTNVNWYEAIAYCRWLGVKLEQPNTISLPTCFQWQWAATAGKASDFPWGNNYQSGRANVAEENLKRTSALGVFPYNRSPFGLMDIVGNVWEWSLSEYDNPQAATISTATRALRGGGWGDGTGYARARDRNDSRPSSRNDSFGFRIVRVLPFSDL